MFSTTSLRTSSSWTDRTAQLRQRPRRAWRSSSPRAADAEGLADRIGRAGRLVLDEDAAALAGRFRKIRYRNEMTSTRTEYGTSLDPFEAVRVRVRVGAWRWYRTSRTNSSATLPRRRRYRGRRGGGDDARGHLRGDGTSPSGPRIESEVESCLMLTVTDGFFRKGTVSAEAADGIALGTWRRTCLFFNYFFVSEHIISNGAIRSDNQSIDTFFLFTLIPEKYGLLSLSEPSERIPNLARKLIEALKSAFKKDPSPEQIFQYIYTLFERLPEKNMAGLKTDFPRVPFTKDYKLFNKLAEKGEELVA